MTEQINTPELRFPEFKREWKEYQFQTHLSKIETGTNKLGSEDFAGLPLLKMGNIQRGNFSFNKLEKLKKDEVVNNEHLIQNKDFLFNTRNTMELVGKSATWRGESNRFAFNSNIARLTLENMDTVFFNYLYNTPKLIHKVKSLAVGTTSVAAIYPRDLKKLKYFIPIFDEQLKIGEFFSKLDRQIELEEQKLAKLEEQKKGYMQQIFSQKLRFKDENGSDYPNWEEVQLKDILIRKDHKQVPEINAPLMSFTSTGGIEPKGDRYNREFLVKNKNKKYKRTEFNDLIYSSNNLDVGAIGLNRYGTSVISDVYEIFKIEEQVSPYFIEMSILQPEFMYKILRYRQGALYGQYRIHANDFLKINIELPCSEEQYKIGDFVNKLDNIIDIINNKIELLKQRKRGFLQKMFI
ncbi:restriction endonuclease subunit S [Staphylococcus arlettae]|uniref:restriction endonuclease subunit S n=1 Tax=Staphylococcus arlettae TaxID=29378 RepID=UPI003A955372